MIQTVATVGCVIILILLLRKPFGSLEEGPEELQTNVWTVWSLNWESQLLSSAELGARTQFHTG